MEVDGLQRASGSLEAEILQVRYGLPELQEIPVSYRKRCVVL